MLEQSELVNLILIAGAVIVLASFSKKIQRKNLTFFYISFGTIALAYIATNLEVFIFPEIINLIEHFLLAMAGVFFAVGCYQLGKVELSNDTPTREA